MKYMVCICYEVYGMRILWSMVCGRKIGLFLGLRICRRRAKLVRQMRVRFTIRSKTWGVFKKFVSIIQNARMGSRGEARAKSMESRGTSWHGISTFSPKMWGKSAGFVQKLNLRSWFSGTSWPPPPGFFNKFCRFLQNKNLLENLEKGFFSLVFSWVIFRFFGGENSSNFR